MLAFVLSEAWAADQEISPQVFETLQSANQLVGNKEYSKAASRLNAEIEDTKNLSSFEQAQLYRMLAHVYLTQSKYSNALSALEKQVSTNALGKEEASDAWLQIGQIYLYEENGTSATKAIRQSITNSKKPKQKQYLLLANALALSKQPREAIKALEKARTLAPLEEHHIQFLIGLYAEAEQFENAAILLEKHIAKNNIRDFASWKQLASFYELAKLHRRSVAVISLAHEGGLLKRENDWLFSAQILLSNEHPYKAAKLLQQAMHENQLPKNVKNYRLLGDAWTAAREWPKAQAALEHAASLSKNGDLYIRLAQISMEREDWQPAQQYLRTALDGRKIRRPGYAYLLQGICAIELDAISDAERAFRQSQQFSDTRKDADQWLDYIAQRRSAS